MSGTKSINERIGLAISTRKSEIGANQAKTFLTSFSGSIELVEASDGIINFSLLQEKNMSN